MSQFFSTRNRRFWPGAAAFSVASALCASWSVTSLAAPTTSTSASSATMPLDTVRSSAAISNAVSSTRVSSTRNDAAMWTTYKGDTQRTGAVDMSLHLPLSLQWRYTSDADPGAIVGSPLVVGTGDARRVIFNAGKILYCLDAASGEKLWSWTSNNALRAPLSILPGAGDAVLALSTKGVAQAVRISDGTPLWKYQADSALNVAPLTILTARGERIVLAPTSGTLVALTPQGVLDPSWRVSLGEGGASPVAAPVASADGTRIFVPANDGVVYAVDVRGARSAFTTALDAASTGSPVALGNTMIAAGGGLIIAVRVDNGSTLWRASTDDDSNFTALSAQAGATSNSGIVYAGTSRGSLLAFSAHDGKPLWKSALGRSALSGSPLVFRGAVLVGSRDGVLYGVKGANGALLWRYRLESERRVLVPVRATTGTNGTSPTTPGNPFASPYVSGARFGGGPNPGVSGTNSAAQRTPTPMTYETRTYGTSSAPAAVDGQIYVPADNAALYAFSSTAFDASPPLISEPTIVIPDTTNRPYPVEITSDFPGIANKGPVSFTLQLADAGSGIDASRLRVTFDGQPVSAADVKYDAPSGVLSLALFKPSGDTTTLSDGTHTINVQVTDYNGNTSQNSTSFLVNSTFVSPQPKLTTATTTPTPQQPQQPQWGGWRGGWDPSQGPPPWSRRRGGGNGGG